MKTIMIDMDNVITDGKFFEILRDYLGYEPDYDKYGYYLQDILGDKKADFFNKFKLMNNYDNAILLPDCYEVLKKLNEHYNLKYKYDYLRKELDFLNPRSFIFTADKSVVDCDIKIDDKLENILGADTKLLFTAYHNKTLSNEELEEKNVIRVNGWKDIEKLLLSDNG